VDTNHSRRVSNLLRGYVVWLRAWGGHGETRVEQSEGRGKGVFHVLTLAVRCGIITYGSWLYDPTFGVIIGLYHVGLLWYVCKEEL